MRISTSTFLMAAWLVTACGDDKEDDGGGSTGTTTKTETETGPPPVTTETSTGPGATTTEGTTETTTEGASTTTGTATTDTTAGSTTEGTTTGGMTSLEVTMSELTLIQDCMPIVEPDPLQASFMVGLSNTGDDDVWATVVSATLIDGDGTDVATIEISPGVLGPVEAGGQANLPAVKLANSLLPPNGCDVLMCSESYTLELELEAQQATIVVSDSATVGCVF